MAGPFDFTGQNIENTYQRVLQTDGTSIYDGTGSLFTLPGVSKITAGGGVIVTPSSGVGDVTITATAAAYNTSTGSYGSFYDTGSQLAVSNLAIYSMSLSTTDISNGVFVSGSDRTRIYFTNAGIYNIQFSAQFSNTGNNPDDVNIWVRKNDIGSINDVSDSSGVCTIPAKKGTVPGQLIASWNYYVVVAANDFIQLCWTANTSNTISLETIAAGTNPVHPRTPSLILTAQRVDTFLSNTGSFSGSFTGVLLGTASNALTASYVNPLNQDVIITGSLFTSGSNGGLDTLLGQLLWDNGGGIQAKVDWQNGGLTNSNGVNTLDWENGALNDNAANPSIDWNARYLFDSTGKRSYNYDARNLIYPNGSTTAINYGTQDQISMTGSVSITGSLNVTGSIVQNGVNINSLMIAYSIALG